MSEKVTKIINALCKKLSVGANYLIPELAKKSIALMIVITMLCGCHVTIRNFGGRDTTLELPKGQKLEEITWRESSLWYLTRPMRDDEQPETYTFKAYTELGMFEGIVSVIESK